MQVHINHQPFLLPDGAKTPLVQLLQQAGITSFTGIALAVNNKVIPRNSWQEYAVLPGDSITLITATQGG